MHGELAVLALHQVEVVAVVDVAIPVASELLGCPVERHLFEVCECRHISEPIRAVAAPDNRQQGGEIGPICQGTLVDYEVVFLTGPELWENRHAALVDVSRGDAPTLKQGGVKGFKVQSQPVVLPVQGYVHVARSRGRDSNRTEQPVRHRLVKRTWVLHHVVESQLPDSEQRLVFVVEVNLDLEPGLAVDVSPRTPSTLEVNADLVWAKRNPVDLARQSCWKVWTFIAPVVS